MSEPRSVGKLVAATFALYRRYPWLFLVLAAAVIVPYELLSQALTGSSALSREDLDFATQSTLTLIAWTLVTPLVSALHVHAVTAVRDGREPQFGPVALQGIRALPVVAAASIVSGLGIGLGFLALIVPGVILLLRWAVVAQAAAIEREGWLPALRRSADLTDGHYAHILIFVLALGTIAGAPLLIAILALGGAEASPAAFLLGLALSVVGASLSALGYAVLYYDLIARWEAGPAREPERGSGTWDPMAYSDATRPKGWYVNPADPKKMNHWGGPELPEWNGTARTPRKIRRAWESENRR